MLHNLRIDESRCYVTFDIDNFSFVLTELWDFEKKLDLSLHVWWHLKFALTNFCETLPSLSIDESIWYLLICDDFHFYCCRFMGSFGNMNFFLNNFRSSNDLSNLYLHSLRVNYFMMKMMWQSPQPNLKKVRWIWPWWDQETMTMKMLRSKHSFLIEIYR